MRQQTRLQRAAVESRASATPHKELDWGSQQWRHPRIALSDPDISEQHLKWARSRALTRNYLSLSPKP